MEALMFQVLDNPSLREEILSHVIFGKDSVDRKAACTLRLVNTSWNESVVRILRKARSYLFELGEGTSEEENLKVETFAASSGILGCVPTLLLVEDLSEPGNLESFSNSLTRCGDGLIQVGLNITENGRTFKSRLPNWMFPCLHKLSIWLLDLGDHQSKVRGQVAVEDEDTLSTSLIKSVLSSAIALEEIRLTIDSTSQRSQLTTFDSIVLPPSITRLTISTVQGTKNDFLEFVVKSPLPILTSLTLNLGDTLLSAGLLSRILYHCRRSLKTFTLGRQGYSGLREGANYPTRFPVMEQLMTLSITGINVQPEPGLESLEKYFPKLHTFRLYDQTVDMFRKWTGSSKFSGVANITLSLVQDGYIGLNLETIQRANLAFPNLRKLEVNMSSEDCSGLRYIFGELRQLTELAVRAECIDAVANTSHFWDSVLTGVKMEVVAESGVRDPTGWEGDELESEDDASIKNLSDLRRFSLTSHSSPVFLDFDRQLSTLHPSISDFTFNCALLRMPKLVELCLEREVKVSDEMTAKWKSEGRSLTFL